VTADGMRAETPQPAGTARVTRMPESCDTADLQFKVKYNDTVDTTLVLMTVSLVETIGSETGNAYDVLRGKIARRFGVDEAALAMQTRE
jgi:hypothetical protein